MAKEQVKRMTNRVVLRGKLREMEVKRGNTENKGDYLRVKGVVQFGPHEAEYRHFDYFATENNSEGKPSKSYARLEEFVSRAKPGTVTNSPTWATFTGSLRANDYINKEDKLIETVSINCTYVGDFDGKEDNADHENCTYDIEAYIQSITDEIKNDEETGRKKVTLITPDYNNEALVLKNVILPADMVDAFEDGGYEVGVTAKFFLSDILHIGEEKKSQSGIGKQRVTTGLSYLETTIVGAELPMTEDQPQYLSSATVKQLSKERKIKLDTLESEGYKGSTSSNDAKPAKTSTIASNDLDDDDIPF